MANDDNALQAETELLTQICVRVGPRIGGEIAAYAMKIERLTGKLSISDAVRSLINLGLEQAAIEGERKRVLS
jgi:hypothetical protein